MRCTRRSTNKKHAVRVTIPTIIVQCASTTEILPACYSIVLLEAVEYSPFLCPEGKPLSGEEILGYGGAGVVVLQNGVAIKSPLRYRESDDWHVNLDALQREQEVYERLGQCEGVVSCVGYSSTTIQLEYMERGDLRAYLKQNRPDKSLQLSWFRQLACALSRVHFCSVIVADINSRNLLLDSNLTVKFCDFSESTVMPLDVDMRTSVDNGYSIQTDIGQLGAVFYEIVTGERCEFDLFGDDFEASEPTWPRRASLPSTEGLWLGQVIERCWMMGAYRDVSCLVEALKEINL